MMESFIPVMGGSQIDPPTDVDRRRREDQERRVMSRSASALQQSQYATRSAFERATLASVSGGRSMSVSTLSPDAPRSTTARSIGGFQSGARDSVERSRVFRMTTPDGLMVGRRTLLRLKAHQWFDRSKPPPSKLSCVCLPPLPAPRTPAGQDEAAIVAEDDSGEEGDSPVLIDVTETVEKSEMLVCTALNFRESIAIHFGRVDVFDRRADVQLEAGRGRGEALKDKASKAFPREILFKKAPTCHDCIVVMNSDLRKRGHAAFARRIEDDTANYTVGMAIGFAMGDVVLHKVGKEKIRGHFNEKVLLQPAVHND